MEGKEDLVLRTWRLADAGSLLNFPLPALFPKQQAAAKAAASDWRKGSRGREVLILELPGGEAEALLLSEPSAFSSTGFRVWCFSNVRWSSDRLRDCARLLFERYPRLYSLELLIPRQMSGGVAGDKTLRAQWMSCYWEAAGSGALEDALLIRFFQPESSRRPLWIFEAEGIHFLCRLSEKEDSLSYLNFLRPRTIVEDDELFFLLEYLGCLDKNRSFQPRKKLCQDTRPRPPLLVQLEEEVREYLQGSRQSFDVPIVIESGGAFQRLIWQTMRHIPYGSVLSYEELASRSLAAEGKGRRYARAAGSACRSNPIVLLIPCHRVIGNRGALTGFGGGVDLKERLLHLEMFNYEKN